MQINKVGFSQGLDLTRYPNMQINKQLTTTKECKESKEYKERGSKFFLNEFYSFLWLGLNLLKWSKSIDFVDS